MRQRVLLTNAIEPGSMARLETMATVTIVPEPSAAALIDAARDVDAIVVRALLPPQLFVEATRLRGVVRHGAGLDMIPLEVASAHGVAVANVPAVNARSVAEFVLGQMISLARRSTAMDRQLRAGPGGWQTARAMADSGTELAGKTVVIVGMGSIGRSLAELCIAGLQMRVIGVRRSGGFDDTRLIARSLDEAVEEADFLVLACPLTTETRGLVDAARLARMKPTAFVVNVARGAVIDESALVAALERGDIAGAALDVFEQQPLADDAPLRHFPQVLLSPHVAGISIESMVRMGHGAVHQVGQILEGILPTHWVNRDAEDAIRSRWIRLDA